ncbi:Na+/H+ antiporter [Cellulomonas sp. JH27-2]|uniref:Na+/H+ antiporter n=1 Tax=Cellulomonas sp. JH27-2 TaxID=2774139 RepID=UPI001780F40B|nr:Na+/H+ antiporter [Cellulomonas sp. JH27-2]MBD8058665.1 Na+/H+ antiporter [Cellulomonas sp. JH27-2]
MPTALLIGILVAGIIVLTPLADRLRVPFPVVLTVFGLLVPLLPSVPVLRVDPDIILPLVLPPLLFAATQRATARDFQENARPILLLAVGLTLASAAAVAVLAHQQGLGWGPAVVLGAVVAPPDPVAATAVARRLRLPGRLVTVLEGEGMFNDATALVLYEMAVLAVVAGGISAGELGLSLVLAVVVGVGLGIASGWVTRVAMARLHAASAETTLTIAVPFAAYVAADRLHGSGVLAVLALGLYLRTYGHAAITSEGWLLGRAVWRYADYLITAFVFVFIGFELTEVLRTSPERTRALSLAAWTCAVLVVVRFVWVLAATLRTRRSSRRGPMPLGGREAVVTSWAGMRGVVTVATALALPLYADDGSTFPGRDTIVVVALVTVLVTLVVQGLTLAPLVSWLEVGTTSDARAEARELRRGATEAVLAALEDGLGDPVPDRVREAVTLQYRGYLAAQQAIVTATHGEADDDDDPGDDPEVQRLLAAASEVERGFVVDARLQGDVSPEAADEVLDEVERRALRDLG